MNGKSINFEDKKNQQKQFLQKNNKKQKHLR